MTNKSLLFCQASSFLPHCCSFLCLNVLQRSNCDWKTKSIGTKESFSMLRISYPLSVINVLKWDALRLKDALILYIYIYKEGIEKYFNIEKITSFFISKEISNGLDYSVKSRNQINQQIILQYSCYITILIASSEKRTVQLKMPVTAAVLWFWSMPTYPQFACCPFCFPYLQLYHKMPIKHFFAISFVMN